LACKPLIFREAKFDNPLEKDGIAFLILKNLLMKSKKKLFLRLVGLPKSVDEQQSPLEI